MTRLRAVLIFMLVVAVALCANTFAGKIGTHSESFAMHETTTSQTAIFGAFLACVPNPNPPGFPLIETAVSVSNITATPDVAAHFYSPSRDVGPVTGLSGDVTAYLYDSSGAVIVAPLGSLDSGQTTSFLLCDALGTDFSGYAWLVADFGAVSGTLTNLWDIIGVGGTFLMEPALGGVPVEADAMEP